MASALSGFAAASRSLRKWTGSAMTPKTHSCSSWGSSRCLEVAAPKTHAPSQGERQLPVGGVHVHRAGRSDFSLEEFDGEGIHEEFLDGAL